MPRGSSDAPRSGPGWIPLFLATVIGVALVGFLVGIRPPSVPPTVPPARPIAGKDVLPSLSYSELGDTAIGPNRDWRSDLSALAQAPPEHPIEVPVTPEEKRQALAERERLRAFNGAPPTIPHDVDSISSESCLVCHQNGLVVGTGVARPVPHEAFASCLQCHVPDLTTRFETPADPASTFVGLPAPFEGERAWPGAPPTVPHTTQLRTNCLACHGPYGRRGLQCSHPERRICLQCHAAAADRDQVFVGVAEAFVPGPQQEP